jgi:DNA-binding Xre family transcriptional regulator
MTSHKYMSIAEALNDGMAVKNIGLQELADKTKISYEHLRKMSKGEATPSASKLAAICKVLDLDLEAIQALEVSERVQKKYGAISGAIPGKNPELARVETLWPKLSKPQRKVLLNLIDVLVSASK